MARRPVVMLGVGAGELGGRSTGLLARYIARQCDLLVLRDEESARSLVEAGVAGPLRVGADPTWVLLDPPQDSRAGRGDTVMVVPSHLATARDGARGMLDRLSRALELMRASGLRVQLRSWEEPHTDVTRRYSPAPRDGSIVAELSRRLGGDVDVAPTPMDMRAAVDAIKDVSAVLAFRFHALVAAGAAGVPTVAITHEPKLAGLARRFGQQTSPVDFGPEHLADVVARTVGSAPPAPALVKDEIAKAEEGFRLLRVLLAGGASEESEALGALPLHVWPR